MKGDWKCTEEGCKAHGHQDTLKAARAALAHHYMQAHNEVDF